jgi:polar amino acid transport system substrate-binding protein
MSCIGTISALITGLTLASAESVIVATDAPFPQYTFIDQAGTITGYERDLLDEVCVRAKLDCKWVDTTFDQLIPGVMSGEFDVIIGGIAITDERRQVVDFTTSYHATDDTEWYIGRTGAPAPEHAMIAVQAGTVHDSFLRDNNRRYQAFSTEGEVFAALADGRADLAFGAFEARDDLDAMMTANGYDFLYSELILDDGIGMAVCKGNAVLLDSLNAALDGMRADGTIDDLETRWFN